MNGLASYRRFSGPEMSSNRNIDPKMSTPLPKLEMACILVIQFNEALQINVLYPFLVFMVESFGYTGGSLGIHAGILASSFCAAQFFSSMWWGKLSDRIGLKPCLLAGMLGSALAFYIFGLATSFSVAVGARAMAGLLSGNAGLLKSFVGRITDDSNRAQGLSSLSLSWGKFFFLFMISSRFDLLIRAPTQESA